MKLREKIIARNSFIYAMETLDLIFMMNVSVVRASFKVFNLLSVADKSNINTFIFKNHCIIEKKCFSSASWKQIILSWKWQTWKCYFTKFIHYKKEWKNENVLAWKKIFWFNEKTVKYMLAIAKLTTDFWYIWISWGKLCKVHYYPFVIILCTGIFLREMTWKS